MTRLTAEWEATPTPNGGFDLHIRGRRSGCVLFFFAVAAAAFGAGWAQNAKVLYIPAAIASALALWTAFAHEHWHVERDLLEHHIGIGSAEHVRRYRGARILVKHMRTAEYQNPYYRMYLIESGKRRFLMDRASGEDLIAFSHWLGEITGWPVD